MVNIILNFSLMIFCMKYFNDVAIVYIKGNDYRTYFWYMSKNDAIALMTNSNLKDKNGIL